MWKDERKKDIITKVILLFLIIVIAGGLIYAMIIVRSKTKEEDELLSNVQSSQQAEQSEARLKEIEDIENLYQKDLEAVASYLPGIVCWGDSITSGTAGNVSYPYVLQKYIQANITDIYTFSDSVPNVLDYSYLDFSKYKIEIPVINMGAGDENARTVLGRAGALDIVTQYDFTIPAEAERTSIYLCSSDGRKKVNPLVGGDGGINKVTISGIEGTLEIDNEYSDYYYSSTNHYYFVRSEPGEKVKVDAGTKVITSSENLYKDYIHVICIGTYGGYDDTSDLVNKVKLILNRQEINKDRYIVLGICSDGNHFIKTETIDKAMLQEFGNRYINIRNYLCSDGITEAKLTLSKDDQDDAEKGIVPSVFRASTKSTQLNGVAYKLIGKVIYDRMESLGYFKEVKDELYIDETVKLLIKENPEYLNGLLENRMKEIGVQ